MSNPLIMSGHVVRAGRNASGEYLVLVVADDGNGVEHPWPDWAYALALVALSHSRRIIVQYGGPTTAYPIEQVYVYDSEHTPTL